MDKQEILAGVRQLAAEKTLTQAELLAAFEGGEGKQVIRLYKHKVGIAEVLSYLGGTIIAVGIAILINQNWQTLNTPTQILSTLGAGIAAYIAAVLFFQRESTRNVSQAFFLLAAIILPIGLGVTFRKAGYDISSYPALTSMAGILTALFIISDWLLKGTLFTLFSVIYGTWLFFILTSWAAGGGPQLQAWHFQEYRVLLIGLSYVLLGYSFLSTRRKALTGLLYSFGVLGVLASALALGGYAPNQNIVWEALFPALVFGVIFLSIYLKSKSFLTFGALFLMAYIMKLTAEYFSHNLGWPLALVIAGLILIGVGYMTYYLNRKYVSQQLV
jgi:hypothetical protein